MSIFRKFGRVTGFALSLVLAITSVQFQPLTVKAEDRVDFSFDINYPGVWDEEDWNERSQQYKQYVTVSYYVAEEQIDISELDSIYTAPYNWINDQVNPGDWIYVEAYAAEGYHISDCEIGYRMEGEKTKLTPNDDKLFSAWYQIPEYGEFAFRVDVGEGEEERYSDGTEFSFDVRGTGFAMPDEFDGYGEIEYRINDMPTWHKARQNWATEMICAGDDVHIRARFNEGFTYDKHRGISVGYRAGDGERVGYGDEILSEEGITYHIDEVGEYSFELGFVFDESWTASSVLKIENAVLNYNEDDLNPVYSAKISSETPGFEIVDEGWIGSDGSHISKDNPKEKFKLGVEYSYAIEVRSKGKNYITGPSYSEIYLNGSRILACPNYTFEGDNDHTGSHFVIIGFAKRTPVIDLSECKVTLSKSKATYTGKAIKPSVTVKTKTGMTVDKSYYKVTYSNNKNAGSAIIKITPKTKATVGSARGKFKINKAAQKPTIKQNKKNYKAKEQVKLTVKKAYGKITYTGSKSTFTISGNKIKIKANAKAGKYTIKAKIAGDKNHKAKTVKFIVTVK